MQVYALKDANTERLIEHARDHGLTLELYSPNALFVERKTPLSEAHAKMLGMNAIVRDLFDVMENEPVVRAQWVVSGEQAPVAMSLKLDAQFQPRHLARAAGHLFHQRDPKRRVERDGGAQAR